MAQLYLSLMTKSPLAIRSDHATGGSKTATTINGSTLLGSLAAAHRMLHADTEADKFVQLFLQGNIVTTQVSWSPRDLPKERKPAKVPS
jgi:hypothetical protein